jgi:hypothetical protein
MSGVLPRPRMRDPQHKEVTAYGCWISPLTRFTGLHCEGLSFEAASVVANEVVRAGSCDVKRADLSHKSTRSQPSARPIQLEKSGWGGIRVQQANLQIRLYSRSSPKRVETKRSEKRSDLAPICKKSSTPGRGCLKPTGGRFWRSFLTSPAANAYIATRRHLRTCKHADEPLGFTPRRLFLCAAQPAYSAFPAVDFVNLYIARQISGEESRLAPLVQYRERPRDA